MSGSGKEPHEVSGLGLRFTFWVSELKLRVPSFRFSGLGVREQGLYSIGVQGWVFWALAVRSLGLRAS